VNDLKFKNLTEQETKELLPDDLILLGYRGSMLHGTYIKSDDEHGIDDKDLMGVFVGQLNNYFGFQKKEVHEKFIKEYDSVCYEIKKFVSLLLKSNPNVLQMLFLPKNYILYVNEFGKMLIDNKELFISKQAYHSFSGYAYGQLKRMTSFTCNGYMGQKRKQLVEKYGYDCKNASHLIRLLRMGIEFLVEGELYPVRKDAKQLIEIKKGQWSLDQVKKEANLLFAQCKEAYIKSNLPDKPKYNQAESLLTKIILQYHQLVQNRKQSFQVN